MNQRFAGIVKAGTNLTRSESAELDALIARADRILKTVNYRRAVERVRQMRAPVQAVQA